MKPKRTILCVDDNEQSLSIRKVMLETRGYRVIACSSGEEALERFKKGGIDLVLTDLIMPGVDGSKLIDAIKTISPQTPAILFSGQGENLRSRYARRSLPAQRHVRAGGIAGAHSLTTGSQARPSSRPFQSASRRTAGRCLRR